MRYVYFIVFAVLFLAVVLISKSAKKVAKYNEAQKVKKSCTGSCESCDCEEQTY